ncbi:MAG: hypothetical protein R2853_05235 [Thermomicrobiales bacterium]
MDALPQPPSSKHWLGLDDFGRDIFSRLLYGARISLEVGIVAVGIAGSVGILLGLLAGYAGGWIDNILTLLVDVSCASRRSCWPSPSSRCWATTDLRHDRHCRCLHAHLHAGGAWGDTFRACSWPMWNRRWRLASTPGGILFAHVFRTSWPR